MLNRKTLSALLLVLAPLGSTGADTPNIDLAARSTLDVQQRRSVRLPSRPLQQALIDFVSQTGTGVVIADGVDKRIPTNAVRGYLNSAQVLDRLLSGTGLAASAKEGYFLIHPSNGDHTVVSDAPPPVLEEVVVTGSWTQGQRFPSASNIAVINAPRFESYGSVSAADLVAYLPSASGTENQTNQFDNNFAAGTSNINLRGLGVSRTLVLLNGRRSVSSALPHNDGQSYVDLNSLPWQALDRIELLKDGAAATYGSDAVAGVVNFITRTPENGWRFDGHFKHVDESEGDWNLAASWGSAGEKLEILSSLEYLQRNELATTDRLEITNPRVDLPDSDRVVFGLSSVGNPGYFLPISAAAAADGISENELASIAQTENRVADPGCSESLGTPLTENRCGYNYIRFDNLVEKEQHLRWFTSADWQLDEHRRLYGELLLSRSSVPQWKTSASYAPLQEADGTFFVPPVHPALEQFREAHPDAQTLSGATADFGGGALYVGRAVGGPEARARRESLDYRTARLLAGMQLWRDHGALDLSLLYAANRAQVVIPDTLKARWQASLIGLGGPNCSGDIPGDNGCQYFNPFSSSHSGTSDYAPELANSAELLAWLEGKSRQTNTMRLATLDALWTSQLTWSNIEIDYAVGAQLRHEQLNIHFNRLSRLDGIELNTGEAPQNALIFFAGGENDNLQQSTLALFGELLLPLTENLEVQAALRFENYHRSVGHNFDPKIAMLWRLNDHWSLRLSGSSSFRAPSLNQTGQNTTSQEFIGDAGVFKAIYRIGNPDLEAETANSFNLGLLYELDQLSDRWSARASLDLWTMQLHDPIIQQSANDIVNEVVANPDSRFANQVIFDSAQRVSHVITHYINGPDLSLQGTDLALKASRGFGPVHATLGVDASFTNRFKVDDSELRAGFDAAGRSNTGTFLQPLPRWKGSTWLSLEWGQQQLQLRWNYVDSYRDEGLVVLNLDSLARETVGSFRTWDLFYRYQWSDSDSQLSLSINNLTNTAPPDVKDDLRYESSLHTPFGRTVSLNIQHDF
jgi:outer membrane receptor protein involved in Fe transport